MISSDQRPPGQDWLVRRVTDLERQVRELQAGRRLEAATIGAGGLTVRGGTVAITGDGRLTADYANGSTGLNMGAHILTDGTPVHGVLIRRPGGELAFWVYGPDSGGSAFWALYDLAGNIIMSDDAASGQGLATPYIPGQFASMSVPTDKTTSGTFTALGKAIWRKQHPKIRLWTLANVTSTTAEYRYVIASGPDTGTVIAGPTSVATGFGYSATGPVSLPGAHLSEFEIDVEGRVASGAGEIGVRVLAAIGTQS